MAEIETYHTQKVEDFASLAKEHLDGEIEFYEQVSDKRTDKLSFSKPRPDVLRPSFITPRLALDNIPTSF